MSLPRYTRWFIDLSKEDINIAGGKGANLGELTAAKIPIPPGFVVLSSAYFTFLDINSLRPKIHAILSSCDVSDPKQLHTASQKIQKLILGSEMPHDMSMEIMKNYAKLGHDVYVAVRSSATAEDLPGASFAGQQESYLNVRGDTNLIMRVRDAWASLFGERAIFYRVQKKFDHFKVGIAVPIQKMIQSEVSGVMFTVDPITQDKDKLVIEAIYGLGDYIVQGVVTPDHYEVSKTKHEILTKNITKQTIMETRGGKEVIESKVPVKKQELQKISDKHVLHLAEIGKKIHAHYFFPQDIEWALEGGKIYITQARPITTLDPRSQILDLRNTSIQHLVSILKGAPAAPGLVSGPVKMVPDVKLLDKIKKGDIMVTDMTTPDFVPAMRRAAGIITNRGGLTSHAAIVSRELGVPCIVGTGTATKILKDGMIVTLNGSTGEIFKGGLSKPQITMTNDQINSKSQISNIKTATKIYVNLAEPERAVEIAKNYVDGVGLLRAEFMMGNIGIHPKKMIADGKSEVYIDKLASDLAVFCKAFGNRPIIYRASDFKTNEYRHLKGGDLYEPEESNPMLGFRGAYRYIKNPDVFELELAAIKKVRNRMGHKNLYLMIPFVRTPAEMLDVKKIITTAGLIRGGTFKLYMMCEIPSNVILLDDFLNIGIDGISIGSNDLTMMIMGTDRDNEEVATEFDERNPAVIWALEKIIKTCIKRGVACGICGQAPSQYPELVEKLVNWGITSISVNPDAIDRTRQIVANCESKLIKYGKNK
ncbi:phosphoenolpyruvate synthase [Candidatus Amesbacteria bacterium]|nr:phosphoenolpyruvate synthase [Candidatus Amesbacteria bacterium]